MSNDKRGLSRRGHGEGSVYQRKDGYWLGRITIGRDDFGKQLRKTFSGKTQKEVLEKMKTFEKDHYGADIPKNTKIALSEWIEKWLRDYKKNTIRQTTYELYESLLKNHIQSSEIGKIPLQKLKTEQIQTFMRMVKEGSHQIESKEQTPLSVSTVNSLHHLIQSSLEQARKNRLIVYNVARDCEKFRKDTKPREALSKKQLQSLLLGAKDHLLYPALVLGVYTGVRRGELLGLSWKNVDLSEGVIRITANLVRVKGGAIFQEPKTKSSIRTLSLNSKVVEVLKEHKKSQESEKALNPDYEDNHLVFCQRSGKALDPNNFKRTFNQWLKKAGLPAGIRFHDLRHTFATNMINAGIDIKTVQSFTGHSDTRTLLDIYAKQVQEAQKSAIEKIKIDLPSDI